MRPCDDDPFDLSRFLTAQGHGYDQALAELRRGCKQSHWMWFVFPQVVGLGVSSMSNYYAIKTLGEAQAYLAHSVLGARLRESAATVLGIEGRSATEIMGSPDDLKLRSSMTLFAHAANTPGSVFAQVLEKYFQGRHDATTLRILRNWA